MALMQSNSMLEDMAAEIGYSATNALVDWFGGSTLYIPGQATEDHTICHIIGLPCFKRLVAMYGSTTITVPMDIHRDRARMKRLIGALFMKGTGAKEIAAVAYLTERQVHYVRRELEEAKLLPLIITPGSRTLLTMPGQTREDRDTIAQLELEIGVEAQG